jgi:hypothetical protein
MPLSLLTLFTPPSCLCLAWFTLLPWKWRLLFLKFVRLEEGNISQSNFYFPIYAVGLYMNNLTVKKLGLEILMDMHFYSPMNTRKWCLECRLPVYACVRPSLAPELFDGLYSYAVYLGVRRAWTVCLERQETGDRVPKDKMVLCQNGSKDTD